MQPYYTEISFYLNVYCLSKTTQFNMKGRVPGPGTRNEMAYCCFALFSFVFIQMWLLLMLLMPLSFCFSLTINIWVFNDFLYDQLTFTDNGPHYHNTALLCYLAEVNATFDLTLLEYNNFEAGEGKTVLDTHFAHVSHKIVRWVRVGNNLDSGDQLANLLEVWIRNYSLHF